MTETFAPPGRRFTPAVAVRALWDRRTWLSTVHVVLDLPIGIAAFVVSFVLVVMTVSLAVTAILAVVTLVVLVIATRVLTVVERSRFRAILGVDIPPLRRRTDLNLWRRFIADVRSWGLWRQVAYHHLIFVTGIVNFVVVVSAWSGGLALATLPIHGWALPDENRFGWDTNNLLLLLVLTLVGWLVLFAAPWVARTAAAVDVALARWLLGPSRSEVLSARVERLAVSRRGVVDAADSERRRIERDLHDGTQQRLVSLAMHLGMTRARMADAPPEHRAAVEQAHEEAKAALAELRAFVRGLHPAVLNDRGLDAALSGLAARSPVPVQLRVDVPVRPTPTIEAVAYFVVSEALTNVAKHSRAAQTEVSVTRSGDRMTVIVADDGAGGASPEAGTGLRGLTQRVASVDGSIRIDSPPGGPTLIVVELPCE